MKSALFHFFKVCFETEVCSEKVRFAVVLRHPFDQTKFRFYFAKHNTRFLYTKENPCSSEMAETRGDTMFPFIFLARTFPALRSRLRNGGGDGIARHFRKLFPFFCNFCLRFFYSCQPSVSSVPEVRKTRPSLNCGPLETGLLSDGGNFFQRT